ncbi:DUF1501 domain-containing protein [Solimicrobium silvestre]|uniref:DUF1501 domain-containing protein n=1 Tax=Solimicrobium silvestre TaxID=2099400 RepID=A0A2S9H3U0_9BURK|nr:DUF1501 domain-containing protein [Solimicrobium silvestre]PRC94536.1 hypothetical protein S2091_0539 [Solimicrobium silvestre]
MKRRQFLQAMAASSLPLLSSKLFAAPSTQPRLLFVFLRGGYDAASLLVPTSSTFYSEVRPNIGIARSGTDANAVISLNSDWGLHPALRDSIYPLYAKGQAAFIPFAGTDDLSRSHFETQDSIELGQPLQGRRDLSSGFLNRLATVLNKDSNSVATMSFTEQLPLVMQGSMQIANAGVKNVGNSAIDARQSQLIANMYQGKALSKQVDEGFVVRDQVKQQMDQMQAEDKTKEMTDASRNAISTKGFGLEARRIGKLMQQQYGLGFVDVGGWDTHVNQGGANGALATKFKELGTGLAAFADEMGSAWDTTTVVVISEFGRTFRENGNRGTDHGHGTVYWVLGGAVHGGKIVGEQCAVEQKTLFQNRDFPVLNEYRSTLGGLFARMYGLSPKQLDYVFAGVKGNDLGLV